MLGRLNRYVKNVSIFLITAALIAGMVGCGPIQYDLTISSTEGGDVTTPGEGTFAYDEGTVINLVAEADEGYQFVNWTGNVSAIVDVNAASTNITMNGHYSITANFAIAIEIWDWYDLDAVRDNLGGRYILMNDLDSTIAGYEDLASPEGNEGMGWQPIGTYDNPFIGSFDGRGYEIRDLYINRPDEDDVGLLSALDQAGFIKNIGVTNATVIGQDIVGGLLGANWDGGTVTNCYSTGSVTGEYYIGGLVGINVEGTVNSSYSTGNVTGNLGVGGLVGANGVMGPGTVTNCYSTGSVTGEYYIGGLVGANGNEGSTVSDSYATGSVAGYFSVGGLVGGNVVGTVTDSYSTGNVTGVDNVGGLVGGNEEGDVSNSYSTGSVTGKRYVGGLVGWNEEGDVSNSYSTGNVTGNEWVGGLVGLNFLHTVSDSYSTGSVTGESYVGGLVGWNEAGSVGNSYSTGSVAGNSSVGGLIGYNFEGTVNNSFWDIETSGQLTSGGGTGKNTTVTQDITTFSGAGWNITAVATSGDRNPAYIWNIVDNVTYPLLSWQS
jgi:hypothetical protein